MRKAESVSPSRCPLRQERQVAQGIPFISFTPACGGLEVPVGGVSIADGPVGDQPVLGIVGARDGAGAGAGDAQPIAVAVIRKRGRRF